MQPSGDGVINAVPIEETIIDPLYEPLKLNRYELCVHLRRLHDISHLRYGLSPYLLFDVTGMKEVVESILKTFGLECNIREEDPEKLKEKLSNNNVKIYEELKEEIPEFSKNYKEFIEKFEKYLYLLEEYIENWNKKSPIEANNNIYWDRNNNKAFIVGLEKLEKRNDIYLELRLRREKIIGNEKEEGIYQKIKSEYREVLSHFLYSRGFNKDNFKKITHLFRLEYPVKVKCPICKDKEWMFMCEEGKIYSLKEVLLRTFELRRARWLYMAGALHAVHRAATHTRLSHEIGSIIVAVNALYEIDVYPYKDFSMLLGEYLLMRGELHEFLMANFLHDIGHPPLSHILEVNPFIELEHEEITRNLILGKHPEKGEMDWYVAERYLLKLKAIKDFEYRFFENRYDPIYDAGEEELKNAKEEERRDKFLEYLERNNEILESEIITVSEVLDNFGVDKKRVVEILSGKIFCPECGKLEEMEIDDDRVKCTGCKKEVKIEKERIYDIQFLNKLIDSDIDFDRMDHVKRDSEVCGLSLISFRLLELLGSMSVVLPGSDIHEDIHEKEKNKPYIFISEDGLIYVMDLLTARRAVFRDILYSDENNWINGVVNQITALAVRYLPHLTNILPFITDQILAHFYTNDIFLGTQIEKLNRLFHGKIEYSAYGKPMRYKLRDRVTVTEDDIERIYKRIEDINDGYEKQELPAVVFYTNIKPTKCPKCGKRKLRRIDNEYQCANCGEKIEEEEEEIKPEEKEGWDDMLVYGKKFILKKKERYFKFKDLVGIYEGTSRERFPERPSELDVKNLFYVWISDFVVSSINKDDIIEKIIDERFVDLDELGG